MKVNTEALSSLRSLEGHRVGVALRDGSRIDDCELVSAGRPGTETIWLFSNGMDVFVGVATILACWEAVPHRRIA